jgi:hypothetical protein
MAELPGPRDEALPGYEKQEKKQGVASTSIEKSATRGNLARTAEKDGIRSQIDCILPIASTVADLNRYNFLGRLPPC